jgi:hypothetical protein
VATASRSRQWAIPLVVLGALLLVTSFFLFVHTPDQVEFTGGLPLECGSLMRPGTQSSNSRCESSLDRHRPRAIILAISGLVIGAGGVVVMLRTRRAESVPQ